jgi:uncharacterized delta-60 repeat protein
MTSFCIARYLSNGELDNSFGDSGKVIIDMSADNQITQSLVLSIGSNDSILVCGSVGGPGVGIAHIRTNGELDNLFGGEAKFTNLFMENQPFPSARKVLIAQSRQVISGENVAGDTDPQQSQPYTVAAEILSSADSDLLSNLAPRVVVIGDVGDFSTQRFVAASRYTIDGQLDQSFSNNGKVLFGLSSNLITARAAAFSPIQNKTVVIAERDDDDLPILHATRFLSDGSLDANFGINGSTNITFFSDNDEAWIIEPRDAVIRKGEIIIAGSGILPGSQHLAAVRLKEDGAEDLSFGNNGVGIAPFGGFSSANSVKIDARTRIISAGIADRSFALARFLPNGRLDQDFNQQGMVITPFDEDESEAFVAKVDSPSTERIVAGGKAGGQFALVRYLENGSLDPTFGINGRVSTIISNEFDTNVLDVAFDKQQRIIAAGSIFRTPPID